jgi:exosortase
MMRIAIPKSLARNGWGVSHAVGALGLLAVGVLVTRDAWADILHIAVKDEESSQVILAPIVACWLVWVRRWRLRQIRPVGAWVGPVMIAAGWFFHSVGDTYLIQSFWHGGAVLLAVGCLITLLGRETLGAFLPAFCVLVFLVPVPALVRQQIALPLQTASAHATQVAFELLGMDVERSGNVLAVNGNEIAIAEACNGLRMVFALTLVTYAFAFGTPLRAYVRKIIVAASPVLAIAANVVRLLPTVWLYGFARHDLADRFHDLSGWIMLPVAFATLMAVIALLRWALVPVNRYTLAYD